MARKDFLKDNKHLILFYNSEKAADRRYLAVAKSSDKETESIAVNKVKVKGLEWLNIAGLMKIEVQKLINKNHPDFIAVYGKETPDLDDQSALKLLRNNGKLLIHPIAVLDGRALFIKSAADIEKLKTK